MKKVIAVLVVLSLLILPLVVGCGNNSGSAKNPDTTGDTTTNPATTNGQPSEAPVPTVKSGPPLTIGASYYPWYGVNVHWKSGYIRGMLEPAQLPLLGEYDNRDVEVAEKHIKWAKDYGIDYFLMSWWGPNSQTDYNIKNAFIKAKNIKDIKIGMLYEVDGRFGPKRVMDAGTEAILKKDMEYLATTYFNKDYYLKMDGKPVVYIYLSRDFTGDYVNVFKNVRKYIKDKFGIDMFIIGDEIFWATYPSDEKISIMDATSIYSPHGNAITGDYMGPMNAMSTVEDLYSAALKVSQNNNKHFIPTAIPGFNDMGVRPEFSHTPIPREMNPGEEGQETTLSAFLEVSYKYMDPTLNTFVITSWNEWHEDTQIEPTIEIKASKSPDELTKGYTYTSYGFKDLETIKAFKEKYSK